jgi:hypothetical protein
MLICNIGLLWPNATGTHADGNSGVSVAFALESKLIAGFLHFTRQEVPAADNLPEYEMGSQVDDMKRRVFWLFFSLMLRSTL